jgi:hypothetical protein
MAWLKGTGLTPDPRAEPDAAGARVPKVSSQVPGFVVEYLNQPLAESPLGSAVPFKVAEFSVTLLAVLVTTLGAD